MSSINQILASFPGQISVARGSQDTVIEGLQAPELATARQMIFVSTLEHFRAALNSNSKIWLVSPEFQAQVPASVDHVLVSTQIQLSMALIAQRFFPLTVHHQILAGEKIHPSAHIARSARLGPGCIVGPGAVVGEDCEIGTQCIIGANSVIEPRVKIGDRTHIHPLVFIAHSCVIGSNCEIQPHSTIGTEGYGYAQDKEFTHYRITHYGRVVIEDNVHIGSGVQIDRGTFHDSRIGCGTKIDNHCHFGHNIQIGKNNLITGGLLAAGSVTIGSYCVFGGRTSIKGHLSICDRVQVGALSAIGKSITSPGDYGGMPLQDIRSEIRTRAAMKSLPSMVKQLRRVLKHLGLESESE